MKQLPNNLTRRVFRKAQFGQDKFILVQKQRIHYIEAGKGEPIVLLPGYYSTHRIWNRLLPLLAADYRVILPSCETEGSSTEEQTDLIASMLSQMHIDKVNLIGGRTGGDVVFDFASRHPQMTNKIISIRGGVFFDSGTLKKPWYKITFAGKPSNSLEERAKSIESPILYIYGTKSDDKAIPLRKNIDYLKNFLPQAWIIALEGGIHDLSMHKPEEIADLILVFLKTDLSKSKD